MLKKALAFLAVIAASAALSGCAITMNMYTNRFQSSEAEGKTGSGYADFFGLEGANELTIIPDTTTTPPDLTHPRYERNTRHYYVGGGIGVMDRMNIELRNPLSDTGTLAVKYQVLGDPRAASKQGNFSLSFAGGFFYASPEEMNSNSLTNIKSKVSRDIFTLDGAIILGYRLNDDFLLYGGGAYVATTYDGKLEQTSATGVVTNSDFTGRANQTIINLGLEWTINKGVIRLEEAFGIARANQTRDAKATSFSTGVSGGFRW